MRVLFVTDLHGNKWKYDRLFEVAKDFQAKARTIDDRFAFAKTSPVQGLDKCSDGTEAGSKAIYNFLKIMSIQDACHEKV